MTGAAANGTAADNKPLVRLDRGDAERTAGGREPRGGAKKPRQHGLDDGDRRGMVAGGAQDRRRLAHIPCPVGQDIEIAGGLDRLPQRLRPRPLLDILHHRRRHLGGEEAHRAVVEDGIRHHRPDYRRPRPRAMMPRRISRVPPRIVHDGACSTVSTSASSNGSRSPRRGPGITSRATSGTSRSYVEPKSLTIAASRLGVSPACNMPATDCDMPRSVHRFAARRPIASATCGSGSGPARSTKPRST